jgi:hypothetical protein
VFDRYGDTGPLKLRLASLYTPYRVDPLNWRPDDQGAPADVRGITYDDILEQWKALVLAYPGSFAAHRLAGFAALMGLGDVYQCWPAPTRGFQRAPRDAWNALRADDLHLREPAVMRILTSNWFPSGTWIFRPWVYFAISAVVAAMLMRGGARENAPTLAMLAAAWVYWATFLLANVACDVRYSYFPISAILLVLARAAHGILGTSSGGAARSPEGFGW